MTKVKTISVRELATLAGQEQIDLIDVRTPAEFRQLHAAMARNIPLDRISREAVANDRVGKSDDPFYVICQSGARSRQACIQLQEAGCSAVNVTGGTVAWSVEGHPAVQGQKTVSLERQVRITAGFLVLLGVGLSFLSPYAIGLSAFVGAGLMFAGITDTCGMGMMLAKMPWNRS